MFFYRKEDNHIQQQQCREDRVDRVGLPDVADHLVCVNQIIHCDKIEPGGKFIKKRVFSYHIEQHQIGNDEPGNIGTHPEKFAVEHPVRQDD